MCRRDGTVLAFFFNVGEGLRDVVRSRGIGDVYKGQSLCGSTVKLGALSPSLWLPENSAARGGGPSSKRGTGSVGGQVGSNLLGMSPGWDEPLKFVTASEPWSVGRHDSSMAPWLWQRGGTVRAAGGLSYSGVDSMIIHRLIPTRQSTKRG